MRYTIIGAGALGTLISARLHHHGVAVEVIDVDSARVERLSRPVAVRGYRLGPATTVPTVSWDDARRDPDVLFLCVPPEQVEDAIERSGHTFRTETPLVVFAGGVDVLNRAATWRGACVHAVANLEVRLNADGEPETGFHNFVWLGNQDATETDVMRRVQRDLAWVAPTLTTKVIVGMVWSKAVFEFEAALPVLAGEPPKAFYEREDAIAVAAELVREALGVAETAGVTPIAFDFFDPNLYHVRTAGERATLFAWIKHAWSRHEQYRVGASDVFTEPAGLGWSVDPGNPACELGMVLEQFRERARSVGRPTPCLDRLHAIVTGGTPVGSDALIAMLAGEVAA